jgi:DNA replication protein DnaC
MSNPLADPDCPLCDGSGISVLDPENFPPSRIVACSCVVRRSAEISLARRLAATGLPGIYAEATVDGLHERDGHTIKVVDPNRKILVERDQGDIDRRIKERLHQIADSPLPAGATVVFTGPPGAGKTYAGAAILRGQIVDFGRTGRYITSYEYLDKLRPDGATPEERRALSRDLRSVDVLLLDDVGIEKGSAFTMRELWYLVDARSKSGLVTLITSNLTPEEIFGAKVDRNARSLTDEQHEALAIGDRIISRVNEERTLIAWPRAMSDWRNREIRAVSVSADRERRVREARDRYDDGEAGEGTN